MKIAFYIYTFLSFFQSSWSQEKRDYEVFQFEGNDSLNGHICKIVKFNEKGLKIFEELINFKSSRINGTSDYIENNFYRDTLLIKTEETFKNSKNKRTIEYTYNSKNLLIKKEFKSYQIRLKKNLKKGISYGDCIIDDDDYDKKASWKIDSKIKFKYNSKNQLIEYYAPKYHWDSQNRYLYEYDENGKLSKETSLNHEEIIWEKHFINQDNGYDYFINWNSEFKINSRNDWPYHYEVRFNNENNNIIKETKTDKNRNLEFKIIRYYNTKNQIIKEERFDHNKNLEITHKFIYY